jgi:general secretion pathway protein I
LKLSREARPEIGDKNAGFTILEVLVAITVVATSLTAIGMLTGATTRGVRSLEQHVALVETTRAVVAALPSRNQLSTGEFTGDLDGSRWRIGVSPFFGDAAALSPDSPWAPATISIQVRSPSGAALNLQTVRLQRKRE